MNRRELRAFANRDPEGFRKYIKGARARDLMARHLLLHQDQVETATTEALDALKSYIQERGWRSLDSVSLNTG